MGTPSAEVEQYLAELEHPLKDGVLRLRAAVLGADPDLTEHVKWNAPSYRYDGQDRVTFRLKPRGQLQLILHRGAKAAAEPGTVLLDDPAGLVTWLAQDRALLDFPDVQAVVDREAEVVRLVRQWVRA